MNTKDLIKSKKECAKFVKTSKYEKVNPDIRKWWWRQFNENEYKAKLPPYNKIKYLKECFSEKELNELLKIGIEVYDKDGEEPVESPKTDFSLKTTVKTTLHPKKKHKSHLYRETYTNPYLQFMQRPEKIAQVWRKKRKHSTASFEITKKEQLYEKAVAAQLQKLNIITRAKITEETIASDYCDWFNNKSHGSSKSKIDQKILLDVFQVLYNGPMATSFKRIMKNQGAVPQITARAMNCLQLSEHARVTKNIQEDVKSLKSSKPQMTAFNTCLPLELRHKPPSKEVTRRWLETRSKLHKDLSTMAAVWEGITNLHTTREFCSWLMDHPEVPLPPYLEQQGLFDPGVLDKSVDENELLAVEGRFGDEIARVDSKMIRTFNKNR